MVLLSATTPVFWVRVHTFPLVLKEAQALTLAPPALIYNTINSSIDKYRGRHDIYGSMIAGAGTGAIWRSTGAFMSKEIRIEGLLLTTDSIPGKQPASSP